MGWFHKHQYKLVGKTYAAPFIGKLNGFPNVFSMQQTILGTTTFLFKCSDDSCGKLIERVCLGKETSCNCDCGCDKCKCCQQ